MIRETMEHLRRNNMGAAFVESGKALLALLEEWIPAGATVGCGDSVTLEETGVYDFLRQNKYTFLDKYAPDLIREEKRQIYRQNFSADVFVTGTNAVTQDGKLFNIDGNGSRVAPMIYGPQRVIVVVGENKIVPDVAAAIERTRQVAAPLDAKRLHKKTPCAKTGHCVDCKSSERICNDFVMITGQFETDRIRVVIVGEKLGY